MGSRPTFLESLSAHAKEQLLHVGTVSTAAVGNVRGDGPASVELRQTAAALSGDVDRLTSQLQASAAREAALQAQLRTAHALLGQQAKASQEHAAAQQASKAAISSQQASVSALSGAVTAAREENAALRTALRTAQGQKHDLQDQLLQAQAASTQLREKYLQLAQLSGMPPDDTTAAVPSAQQPKLSRLQSELELLTQQNSSLHARVKQLSNQLAEAQCQASGFQGRKSVRDAVSQRQVAGQAAKVQAARLRVQQLKGQLDSKDKALHQKDQYITRLEQALLQQHKLLQQLTRLDSQRVGKQHSLSAYNAEGTTSDTRLEVDQQTGIGSQHLSDDLANIRFIEAELQEMQQQLSALGNGGATHPSQAAVVPGPQPRSKPVSPPPRRHSARSSCASPLRGSASVMSTQVRMTGAGVAATQAPAPQLPPAPEYVEPAAADIPATSKQVHMGGHAVVVPAVQSNSSPLSLKLPAASGAQRALQAEEIAVATDAAKGTTVPVAEYGQLLAASQHDACTPTSHQVLQGKAALGNAWFAAQETPSTVNTFLAGLISPQHSPTPQPRSGAHLVQAINRSLPSLGCAVNEVDGHTTGAGVARRGMSGKAQVAVQQDAQQAPAQSPNSEEGAVEHTTSHQAAGAGARQRAATAALARLAARRQAAAQRHVALHSPTVRVAGRSQPKAHAACAARTHGQVHVTSRQGCGSPPTRLSPPVECMDSTCGLMPRLRAPANRTKASGRSSNSIQQLNRDVVQGKTGLACPYQPEQDTAESSYPIKGRPSSAAGRSQLPESPSGVLWQSPSGAPAGLRACEQLSHARIKSGIVLGGGQLSSMDHLLHATEDILHTRSGSQFDSLPKTPMTCLQSTACRSSSPGRSNLTQSWPNSTVQNQQMRQSADCPGSELQGPSQLLDLHVPGGCLLGVQPYADTCLRLSWSPPRAHGSQLLPPTGSCSPAISVKPVSGSWAIGAGYGAVLQGAAAQHQPPTSVSVSDANMTLWPPDSDVVSCLDQSRVGTHQGRAVSPTWSGAGSPQSLHSTLSHQQPTHHQNQTTPPGSLGHAQALQRGPCRTAAPVPLAPELTVSSWHGPPSAADSQPPSAGMGPALMHHEGDTSTPQHERAQAPMVLAEPRSMQLEQQHRSIGSNTLMTQGPDEEPHSSTLLDDAEVNLRVLEQASLSLQQLALRLRLTSDAAIELSGTPGGSTMPCAPEQ